MALVAVQDPVPESRPAGAGPSVTGGAIAHATAWMAVGHVVSQVAWFGSLIVLATLVPPRSFGTFTASIVIIGVAMLLMEAGTRGNIVVTRRLTLEHVRASVVVNTAAGLGLAGLLAVAAAPILGAIVAEGDADVLRVLSASLVLSALSIVPLALLQREMRFKRHAASVSAAALAAALLAIICALQGAGVWALVVRQVTYGLLVSVLAWWNVRDLLPSRATGADAPTLTNRRRGATAFFALAAANLIALNIDYVIVGNATDAHLLGIYSLAFTLAFAPLTNFSWKIGTVLFPAASATADLATVAARTLRSLQLMSLVLLPLLVPAIALASPLLPGVLGGDWMKIVVPFQILVVAGVGHAIVNVIGESLSGTGNVRIHAWLQALMCAMLVPVMIVLVRADGLRGAATAHLVVFAVVAAGYLAVGARRLGLSTSDVWKALAPVAGPVAAQTGVTLGVLAILTEAGAGEGLRAVVGTIAGALVAVALFRTTQRHAWRELSAVLRILARRGDA